ncbi:MAG: pyridoxal phosphate-dependent aminotransferase [Candidatus Melainabacteria bacterium]|nr:pyridoxal phosphate-dependent aminotransferase [Candidatus Melainabacteria bacterium]
MKPLEFLSSVLGAAGRRLSRKRKPSPASRLQGIAESRLKAQAGKKPAGGIDLASGAPEFATPTILKELAIDAIGSDQNQYSHAQGDPILRANIADQASQDWGRSVDADSEVTITSGTSAGLAAIILSFVEPGSEVVVFEPFFESYLAAIKIAGGIPRVVGLEPGSWRLDRSALGKAFNRRTRAVILNTPHNPTGRVFDSGEIRSILSLAADYGAVVLSDEIYSQLTFDRKSHLSPASFTAFADRIIVVDGLSKAYNATGWRVGYVIAPPELTASFRKMHSTLGLSAPTPFQVAARSVFGVRRERTAEGERSSLYQEARDRLCTALSQAGFLLSLPEGGAFVLADGLPLTTGRPVTPEWLLEATGVRAVSGDSFFASPANHGRFLRFCFARRLETIDSACQALSRLG